LSPPVLEAIAACRHRVLGMPMPKLAGFRLAGPDAATLLHNRCSSDVKALAPGTGSFTALLDRKAHVQAIGTLHRHPNPQHGFWLLCEEGDGTRCADIQAELARFRIIEAVDITPLKDMSWVALQGPLAASVLEAGWHVPTWTPLPNDAPLEDTALSRIAPLLSLKPLAMLAGEWLGASVTLVRAGHWTREDGFLMGFVGEPPTALLREACARLSGCWDDNPKTYDTLCLEAAWPRYGADYDTTTLLPETGLQDITVSDTKGCYLGQETVARVKTYGSVQQALCGLVFSPTSAPVAWPQPGTALHLDSRSSGDDDTQDSSPRPATPAPTLGHIASSGWSPTLGRFVALAYLGKLHRVPGQVLRLQWPDGPILEATVTMQPFVDARREALGLLSEGLQRFADNDPQSDAAAQALLQRAQHHDPTLADAYEALGVLYSRAGRNAEAIALMQRLSILDPNRVMAHTNLSIYFMRLGDKERAETEKARATVLAMRLKAQQAGMALPSPEDQKQRREAAIRERIALFQQALASNPDDPLGNYGLGAAYAELGAMAEAVAPLQKAMAGQPNHSATYLLLGKTLETLGQASEARLVYQQGVAVAARRGDRMPMAEMQQRLAGIEGNSTP
jgi:folate-binding protein YgfZ